MDHNQLVFAHIDIASGMNPFFTRPDLFKITEKKPAEDHERRSWNRRVLYYLEDVPE